MSPSRLTVPALALLVFTAGCLGSPVVDGGPTPTDQTRTPSPSQSPTATPTEAPTSTPPDHEYASNEPDPDTAVVLANRWTDTVEIHVTVVREATNETVHEASYDVTPGVERTVYNTEAADPDGVESFTVVTTARNTTESVTIETSECYGDVFGAVQEDGTFYGSYAIC